MSDVISIELLLDPESEMLVRDDWDRLAAAGHSSLAPHRSPTNRPHVTMLVRATLEPVDFAAAVALLPVAVTLAEPMVFEQGDRGVLARRVVLSDDLLRLHAAISAAVPPGDDEGHTDPASWTPHVTLARRLRLSTLEEAVAILGPERVGTGVALRRWDSARAEVTDIP